MSLCYVKKNARKLLSFLAFGSFETLDSKLSHGTSQKVADVRHHIMKDSVEDCIFIIKKRQLPFFSMISYDVYVCQQNQGRPIVS